LPIAAEKWGNRRGGIGFDAMRVALVYEEFRLDRSLARDRVLFAQGLTQLGFEIHVYCDPRQRTADVPGIVFHDVASLPRPPTRIGRALEYASFATAATRRLRADRPRYDIVDVAGTTAWEHDVVRVHAVQKAEQRRWPERGGRGYRFSHLRASLVPVTDPRLGIARAIERAQFRRGGFRRALAVTEEVKEDLCSVRGVDGSDIDVIPYPVETRKFADAERGRLRSRLGMPANSPLALFVGHDYERKGLAEAIRGVAELAGDVTLVVVGEGDSGPYRKLAAELGVERAVRFVGGTDSPESFLADADVFLLPTREDVWGISVVEAMAAGTPVIVGEDAGVARVVSAANAGLVVACSPRAVRDALRGVLDDRASARAMGERGRAAAARFDVGRIADDVAAAYERAAAARGSRRPGVRRASR
jgi:glycosyltransferase involved in cell wall biosynthesis